MLLKITPANRWEIGFVRQSLVQHICSERTDLYGRYILREKILLNKQTQHIIATKIDVVISMSSRSGRMIIIVNAHATPYSIVYSL